jgi:fluoroquinolone transport system permease protein
MTRLLATMRLDATMQWRNRFYYIGIGLALLLAAGLAQFIDHRALSATLPLLFLFAIGGTTMLYVAGLVIFEKDERTLEAVIVTPIRIGEYMISKLITLTFLAALESVIVLALAYGLTGFNAALLLAGIILMGAMLTLVGFVMIVRYDSITDFLIPVVVVNLALQLPALYFTGVSDTLLWLIVPTTAPTMLMWAAWHPVEDWHIIYGLVYSLVIIAVLYRWALAAFHTHIIMKARAE